MNNESGLKKYERYLKKACAIEKKSMKEINKYMIYREVATMYGVDASKLKFNKEGDLIV